MLPRISYALAMLATALAVGCVMNKPHGGAGANDQGNPTQQSDAVEVTAKPITTPTPIPIPPEALAKMQADPALRSQVDVEMTAQWISPGILRATLMNKTQGSIRVGPENFALILPPNHALIQPLPTSRKMFPVADLGAGEQAAGELQFPPLAGGGEARLVFNHPDLQPAIARVR